MMRLQELCEALCRLMEARDIPAMLHYPAESRKQREQALVVICLREMDAQTPGFCNYVGERVNPETKEREELYAQHVKLKFALDLYSPKRCGEAGIWGLMEKLLGLLPEQLPAGLSFKTLLWKDMTYDRSCDMFCRAGSLLCDVLLYSVHADDGSFLDFEVKGGMTLA